MELTIEQFGEAKRVEREVFDDFCATFFVLFDKNCNGVVDLNEVLFGLSIMFNGSEGDKISVAFDLFDTSGDGFLQFGECVTYLSSLYRVIINFKKSKISPDEIANATAKLIFDRFG
jgi:Ca2+-binding EF-hand superfamily protein